MAFATRDGVQLHYISEGSGETVLMLQGVGLPWTGWMPQIPALAAHYRVIAPDNRGIGQSDPVKSSVTIEEMAADALAVLEHAGVESAHLVGHSMGGIIAQQIALDAPERTKSLALMCTTGCARRVGALTWGKLWMGLRGQIGTRPMRRRAFMEMILTPEQHATLDLDAFAQEMEPIFGRDLAQQPPIAMRQIQALRRHDIYNKLEQLRHIPSFVLSGKYDVVVPPIEGQQLAEALGCELELWTDAAHGLPITHAEQTNTRLLQHLDQA